MSVRQWFRRWTCRFRGHQFIIKSAPNFKGVQKHYPSYCCTRCGLANPDMVHPTP